MCGVELGVVAVFASERQDSDLNLWPCFVDALSSLLIVIVFVIMGAFLSQAFLSTKLNTTDSSLKSLQTQYNDLKHELDQGNQIHKKALEQIEQLHQQLGLSQKAEMQLKVRNVSLSTQVQELTSQIEALNKALSEAKTTLAAKEQEWKESTEVAINEKLEQIVNLNKELETLKSQIPPNILKNPEILRYRSEFFGALQDILGARADIRVVGDRFVFQAEVLFEKGSAELGNNGKLVLDTLANVLKELSKKIPDDIQWILRVDGHTDRLPIHNDLFDSNWELSLARATCVVKYLIGKGIDPKHLAATGFAEHQPLTTDASQMAKNRRIEFCFDQKISNSKMN